MDEPLSNLDAKLRVTDAYRDHQAASAPADHLHLRYPRPDRGHDHGFPYRRYEGRLHPAGRYSSEPVRLSGQPVRCRLHRQPADELLHRQARSSAATACTPSSATTRSRSPTGKLQKFVSDSATSARKSTWASVPRTSTTKRPSSSNSPDSVIDVDVEVTELMGSETYLYLKTTGKDENIIARVDPRSTVPCRRQDQGCVRCQPSALLRQGYRGYHTDPLIRVSVCQYPA